MFTWKERPRHVYPRLCAGIAAPLTASASANRDFHKRTARNLELSGFDATVDSGVTDDHALATSAIWGVSPHLPDALLLHGFPMLRPLLQGMAPS